LTGTNPALPRVFRSLALIALVSSTGGVAAGQQSQGSHRTPWGDPDLQGIWDYRSATPLERPERLKGRSDFSEEEAGTFEQSADERFESFIQSGAVGDFVGDEPWADRGQELTEADRASLIVDPPDGRLPPRTEFGKTLVGGFQRQMREPPAGPENRTVLERCLIAPLVPLRSMNFNNNVEIIQTSDYVVVTTEMIHQARIIPIRRSDHPEAQDRFSALAVRQHLGNSVGYWNGETFVVRTTGFRGSIHPFGLSSEVQLEERFTLGPDSRLIYEYTVTDPRVFETPWTARQTLKRLEGRIYEYACHEGNQSMRLMLRSARVTESSLREEPNEGD
jgi:hypothetical protein